MSITVDRLQGERTVHTDEVFKLLSPERMEPYLAARGGDPEAAVALYRWNCRVAAELSVCIGHLEVLLRNALSAQLTRLADGVPWYIELAPLLDERAVADIDIARRRAVKHGRLETDGRVIAELTFGFWRFLLSPRYHRTLWMPGLRHALPGIDRSLRGASKVVGEIHELRNRIAHHEPIHTLGLDERHRQVLRVASWIDPRMPAWIEDECKVVALLSNAPSARWESL
ncbi:hypothetical protein [Oerskovia turbata]